jgi:hypothetical protein
MEGLALAPLADHIIVVESGGERGNHLAVS